MSAELIFSITIFVVAVRPEVHIHTQRTLFLSWFLSFEWQLYLSKLPPLLHYPGSVFFYWSSPLGQSFCHFLLHVLSSSLVQKFRTCISFCYCLLFLLLYASQVSLTFQQQPVSQLYSPHPLWLVFSPKVLSPKQCLNTGGSVLPGFISLGLSYTHSPAAIDKVFFIWSFDGLLF